MPDSAQAGESVPDLLGLSLRDAYVRARWNGLAVDARGSGWVVRQSPDPYAPREGKRLILWLTGDSCRALSLCSRSRDHLRYQIWAIGRRAPSGTLADRVVSRWNIAVASFRVRSLEGLKEDGRAFLADAVARRDCGGQNLARRENTCRLQQESGPSWPRDGTEILC
jgi:hypothetical protein